MNTPDPPIAAPLSRRRLLRAAALGATVFGPVPATVAAAAAKTTPPLTEAEQDAIIAALGKRGRYVEDEAVYTVPLPRADLSVRVKGDPVPTGLGFGGWVSIKRTLDGRSAVLMSDAVLQESEVNGLIDAAHRVGIEVGAIHNHFFYEEPRIVYVHLHADGAPGDLAVRYAEAIKDTPLFPANQPKPPGVPLTAPGDPAPPAARTAKDLFNLPELDLIVGQVGTVNGPAYKYTVGRADLDVRAMGARITTHIGLNSWLALAGTREAAHGAGDLVMLAHEVDPVIRVLRKRNIEAVALHHHMLTEEPRTIFLHYYGRGRAVDLTRAFRAALDELGKKPDRRHG